MIFCHLRSCFLDTWQFDLHPSPCSSEEGRLRFSRYTWGHQTTSPQDYNQVHFSLDRTKHFHQNMNYKCKYRCTLVSQRGCWEHLESILLWPTWTKRHLSYTYCPNLGTKACYSNSVMSCQQATICQRYRATILISDPTWKTLVKHLIISGKATSCAEVQVHCMIVGGK